MGADIHVFVQAKNEKTGNEWKTLQLYTQNLETGAFEKAYTVLETRNYDLFSFLAGVRGCYEPIDYPRGWPKDITPDVRDYMYYKNDDADEDDVGEEWLHSYTWYDYLELKLFARTPEAIVKDDFKNYNPVQNFVDGIDTILDAYWIWNVKPGEVRVLIAFDN